MSILPQKICKIEALGNGISGILSPGQHVMIGLGSSDLRNPKKLPAIPQKDAQKSQKLLFVMKVA